MLISPARLDSTADSSVAGLRNLKIVPLVPLSRRAVELDVPESAAQAWRKLLKEKGEENDDARAE